MNERLKRVLIIAGFAAVVVGLVYLIYYFFFKPLPQPINQGVNQNLNQGQNIGQLPTVGLGNANTNASVNVNNALPSIKLVPQGAEVSPIAKGSYTKVNDLVTTQATAAALTPSGQLNYFNSGDGYFYRILPNGTASRLNDQRFYAVQNITWTRDASKAVLEYPDGSNIVYDFNQNKQYTLPKEFQNFAFSSTGDQIAADVIGPKIENNWLVTSNVDGSNVKFIERVGDKAADVDVNWSPNGQVVALYRKNSGLNSQEIIFIGQNEENFKSLDVYGRGFVAQWTPDGNRLLYSVFRQEDDFKPSLWIVNANGDNIGLNNVNIGLNTWSDKCVIGSDNANAYCAVPKDLPFGSGIYPALNKSNDQFYRIDLATGQKSIIADPVGNLPGYQAQNMHLSTDQKVLYFQDARTGGVYSLNL